MKVLRLLCSLIPYGINNVALATATSRTTAVTATVVEEDANPRRSDRTLKDQDQPQFSFDDEGSIEKEQSESPSELRVSLQFSLFSMPVSSIADDNYGNNDSREPTVDQSGLGGAVLAAVQNILCSATAHSQRLREIVFVTEMSNSSSTALDDYLRACPRSADISIPTAPSSNSDRSDTETYGDDGDDDEWGDTRAYSLVSFDDEGVVVDVRKVENMRKDATSTTNAVTRKQARVLDRWMLWDISYQLLSIGDTYLGMALQQDDTLLSEQQKWNDWANTAAKLLQNHLQMALNDSLRRGAFDKELELATRKKHSPLLQQPEEENAVSHLYYGSPVGSEQERYSELLAQQQRQQKYMHKMIGMRVTGGLLLILTLGLYLLLLLLSRRRRQRRERRSKQIRKQLRNVAKTVANETYDSSTTNVEVSLSLSPVTATSTPAPSSHGDDKHKVNSSRSAGSNAATETSGDSDSTVISLTRTNAWRHYRHRYYRHRRSLPSSVSTSMTHVVKIQEDTPLGPIV